MKLKIGTKFAIGFGTIIFLILIMAITSFIALQRVKQDIEKNSAASARMVLAEQILVQHSSTVSGIRAYVAYGNEAYYQQIEGNFEKTLSLENELLSAARNEKKPEVQGLIDQTTEYKNRVFSEIIPNAKRYHEAAARGDTAHLAEYKIALSIASQHVAPAVKEIDDFLTKAATDNVSIGKDLMLSSIATANTILIITILISAVSLILGCLIAWRLTNSIRKPVLYVTHIADAYASGDLKQNIEISSSDEIGDLGRSLNIMHQHFVEMISTIRSASEQLVAASEQTAASTEEITATAEEISRNMQSLSREAETGNNSMVEASKALVQLASLVQIAKSKAARSSETSEETMLVAEDGRSMLEQSVEKMSNIKNQTEKSSRIILELNEYSQKIAQIIDMITGIASQTNLLALNAAIEAARAGEQGRGFAVVAEEVRKLAEQSSQGAQEITVLVNRVTEKTEEAVQSMDQNVVEVEQGVQKVNEAGRTIERILQAVRQTVGDTKEIMGVTAEEVATSEQIMKLIDSLATVIETVTTHCEEVAASTEQQTAGMQSVAASSEETSAMANQLETSVERFKL